ncbi:unnamed protein product [Rotaria socialis]|uniref:Uncharacterized protein n=1 Tax=Rotaria socialis TaxID=392032 RepID=A0A818VER7_9BILA|nr:unnamed protein product [Rotaria socialis]CAF3701790.1 unnamed protein product [Rotaria socialis]CAF3705817.1 unnamed protein product [Rotaria socialis]CAF4138061.1 unnamed protein product [Rotaria socialis]CAF4290517.1 unnamed protein product [Rotaria socialis]
MHFKNSSAYFTVDTQNGYAKNPMVQLRHLTLHNNTSEDVNNQMLNWIQIFIARDYMPALQIFKLITNKNTQSHTQQPINMDIFSRPDIRIDIL